MLMVSPYLPVIESISLPRGIEDAADAKAVCFSNGQGDVMDAEDVARCLTRRNPSPCYLFIHLDTEKACVLPCGDK